MPVIDTNACSAWVPSLEGVAFFLSLTLPRARPFDTCQCWMAHKLLGPFAHTALKKKIVMAAEDRYK